MTDASGADMAGQHRPGPTMHMIFLHGPAAAGKLTTARALAGRTGFAVFHNHLVVDALLALFPFGSDEFVRLRDLYWMSAFHAAAAVCRSFIFTFAPEPTVPADFPARAAAAVTGRGEHVAFVALDVSPGEQEARIENADRRAFNKLADHATLLRLRRDGVGTRPTLPADLTIDTDTSSAEATAAAIQAKFNLVPVEAHTPYPE
ncbi:MAG TPA: hypothetical protein VIL85_06815 [Thermomicrobiales bacterium]